MHYFLIAGEASGDLHAASLITALREADPEARFTFLGGDLMAKAAGHEPLIHYSRMAFMGFTDVLLNARTVMGNLSTARRALEASGADCFIPVDYPSFNLRIASRAHALGIPVYYYISPKIWAWKQWRVRDIKALVRKVLCILPFEPDFYRRHGYNRAVYTGNPSVEEMAAAMDAAPGREEFAAAHRLRSNRPFIALLPGSRQSEVKSNLPVMDAVARQFPQYTIAVAGAPSIPNSLYRRYTKFSVLRDSTTDLLANSHAALVTSGTATLETALAGVPQVVLYRSNGSRMTYSLMKSMLHIPYVSLPNLIAGRAIVAEMLLHQCTPESVVEQLRRLTPDNSPYREHCLEGYAEMRERLGTRAAAEHAADEIISDLKQLRKSI